MLREEKNSALAQIEKLTLTMLPARQTWLLQTQVRAFSSHGPAFAKALNVLNKKGRQELREARQLAKKTKTEGKKKSKKGGLTHYRFKDAVNVLRSESNTVPLESLGVTSLDASDLQQGSIVSYSQTTLPILKGGRIFKKYQHHELFEQPISIVSRNTKFVLEDVLNNYEKNTKDNRFFLSGERGVGKSTLLAQAQALALSKFNNDVVLLHFELPENVINGTSDYLFNKEKGIYQQPMFTKRWIGKTRFVNEKIFRKMPLSRDFDVATEKSSFKLKKDTHTVYDFLARSRDFTKASSAFDFLIEQLQFHSKNFPVICTIDNFNGLVSETYTKYRHPDFKPIHVTEFEMGNYLLDLFNGDVSFQKGAVLASLSKSLPNSKSLNVGLGIEEYDPYSKKWECDRVIAERLLKNGATPIVELQNLTSEEARTLVLFYNEAGVLKVRDYPYKEVVTMPEDKTSVELMKLVGALPEVADAEAQLERLINSSFNVSQGNPGHLLKATAFEG